MTNAILILALLALLILASFAVAPGRGARRASRSITAAHDRFQEQARYSQSYRRGRKVEGAAVHGRRDAAEAAR